MVPVGNVKTQLNVTQKKSETWWAKRHHLLMVPIGNAETQLSVTEKIFRNRQKGLGLIPNGGSWKYYSSVMEYSFNEITQVKNPFILLNPFTFKYIKIFFIPSTPPPFPLQELYTEKAMQQL